MASSTPAIENYTEESNNFIDVDNVDNIYNSSVDNYMVEAVLRGVQSLSENKVDFDNSQLRHEENSNSGANLFENSNSGTDLCDNSNNGTDLCDISNYVNKQLKQVVVSNVSENMDASDTFNSELGQLTVSKNVKKNEKVDSDSKINLEGRRILDIQYFLDSLILISNHAPHFGCSLQNLKVTKETRFGLASKITFKCNMCLSTETVTTVEDFEEINKSAVFGITNVGSGYAHSNEFNSSLNIPTLSSKTYNKIQDNLSDLWEEAALEEMAKAANEEKRLAIECGELSKDGIPLVTVVCDGVWAKRSYRMNYNSFSGAAVIVGFKTKKVLFLTVRNKFCIICKKYSTDTPQHNCYKNWNGSSSAMEANIITEGFIKSIEMYGLIFNKMVADGDSSCYDAILQKDPYKNFDISVQKVECRNHLLRNYLRKIRGLTQQKDSGPLQLRKEVKYEIINQQYEIINKSITYVTRP
ncbi:uncharacterized protein LOC126893255 [Diabrotica virgifera virgifera]|uniref:Mutator-like transposase domain-containing protein n=1 Tax=Diabrotica virgifera virgifera TaxID=50390 RepID=A0ABM5L9U8_DIAVI|nr:uncharacterized protein LOC126893255 [Diabrotica virgifera virgifera]